MPIISVILQRNNNISNNKNKYIMVSFKLFANVNPFEPYKLVCVMVLNFLGMTNLRVVRSLICKKAVELFGKGFEVRVHEISDVVLDYINFV